MPPADHGAGWSDPFDLQRFLTAQEEVYGRVLQELHSGRKRSHWMWYIFPQLDGLGHSATAHFYALKSLEEARRYLRHPVLGKRLVECAAAVLAIQGRSVLEIFGSPDVSKLKSSMTLFGCAAEPESVFVLVLEKYYRGERDEKTLQLLKSCESQTHAGETDQGLGHGGQP